MKPLGWWILFALSISAPSMVLAQSVGSGTVTGVVSDSSALAIPGARVELKNALTGHAQTTLTDSTGEYRFNNVPPNRYVLSATAKNFATVARPLEVRSAVPVEASSIST